jgi:hypothetical protein
MRPLMRRGRLAALGAALVAAAACGTATPAEPIAVTQVREDVRPLRVLSEAVGLSTSRATDSVTTGSTVAAGLTLPALPVRQLPRGGRQIFPTYTVVAHYGTAGTGALGVLGEGSPASAGPRLLAAAAPFAAASGRRILPAFELIASIAQRAAGPDGTYSTYIPDSDVARYLAEARKVKALVILDLQPGKADFLDQAKHFEKFLAEPDVGLALDPEWKLYGKQLPGKQIGYVDAATVNRVSAWLAQLRQQNALPEKLFLLHQFRDFMIRDRAAVVARSGLATVVHLDGFGPQHVKRNVYAALSYRSGPIHNGLKLFIDEDTDLFTPREAMAFRPRPELVTYQ